MTIEDFVNELSSEQDTEYFDNFYRDEDKKYNLKIYLYEMKKLNPDILFVGEAPGYLGCAITGVPFTDERIIKDYKDFLPGEYRIKGYQKERTAKAMWDIMRETGKLPLLWNSFPLHPHKSGNIQSNCAPRNKDKQTIGRKYIKYLLYIFDIKEIYAIGCQAFNTLKGMDLDGFAGTKEKSYIRHPSYGGKTECYKKIKEIFKVEL